MAVYEFKCGVCGNTDTVSRAIDADGDIAAPQCRGCMIPMERIWSASAISFKGTGWGHQ
jgi:putative FmdB family regulatory protein